MFKNDRETINDQSVADDSEKLELPNCTLIPNVYFDYWMRRLSLSANRVIWHFYFNDSKAERESPAFTVSQIVTATGRSRNTVSKALLELVNHGLIKRIPCLQEKGHTLNCYVLNSDDAQMEE